MIPLPFGEEVSGIAITLMGLRAWLLSLEFNTGARSGMSVFAGIVVLMMLLFLTPLLCYLPQSVLAAVIMMAVIGLIDFKAIRHAWGAHPHDGAAAMVTFVATLALAPHLDSGIPVGAGLAVGLFLYRTMTPRVALLGRYPDGTLRDLRAHPNLPTDERIVVMRFDGQLYFANVSYFEDTILSAVADHPSARYILVVADGINQLDASGQEILEHLIERLGANGIQVVLSGVKRQVIQVLERTHLIELLGRENLFATEEMALDAIYDRLNETGHRPLRMAAIRVARDPA